MTEKQIAEQIATIRAATARAMVSREAATAFLRDAGIIETEVDKTTMRNSKNGQLSEKKGN